MTASNKTLLQMVNAAQGLLGLPQSTSVVGNTTDFSAIQFLNIANEIGEELRDWPEQGWTALQLEFNIAVTAPLTFTCNLTNNSATVTSITPALPTAVQNNPSLYAISGSAIPQAARISSIISSSSFTMTMEATGNATAETITLGQDTYAIPGDFKAYIGDTWWDRTNHWRLFGPDSPQLDQWHRSGIVATGPRRHWRQLGHLSGSNVYRLWPPPFELVNPIQIAFEYNSTDFVNVSNGFTTTSSSFTQDIDTTFLDDRAMIKMMLWKYQAMKGMAFDWYRNDATDFIRTLISRDGGSKVLPLAAQPYNMYISPWQVMDGNWPGPLGPNTG